MPIDITQLARNHPMVHMRVTNMVLIWVHMISPNLMDLPCEHCSVYVCHMTMVAISFKLDFLDGDVPSVSL